MNVKIFQLNMLQENCYIVSDDSGEAAVIDCGAFFNEEREAVKAYLRNQQLHVSHVLCTHGHLDHVFGNDLLLDEFGVGPEVHAADEWLIDSLERQAETLFGMDYPYATPPVSHWLEDGETITVGTIRLRVIHTPGHTPGGVVFYCEEAHSAFTGDTLFRMSIGRTDFPRSSWTQMEQSLRRLAHELPPETAIFSGHGSRSVMADELRSNPYLRS